MAMLNAVAPRLEGLRDFESKENLRHLGNLYGFLFAQHVQRRVRKVTLREIPRKIGPFYPLSPWACAAMTDACLRFCHLTQGARVLPPARAEYFGRMLLTFQTQLAPDHVRPALPDFDRLTDAHFAELARNQLRANPRRVGGEDRLRLYAMFEVPEISEVMREKLGKTAAEWFAEQTGMSAEEYRFTVLGLMATTMEFRLERPEWEKLTFDISAFLGNLTPEAREPFRQLIDLAVIDLSSLRAEPMPGKWKAMVYGPNSLLRRQLLRISPTRYVILQHDFFMQRYFRGWMHVLDDLARKPGSTRSWQRLRSDCGYLFEGYIRWWLKNLFGPTAHYLFGAKLIPRTERDAVVVVGRTALVVEANHHWLNRMETFDATPAALAAIVASDLIKAIEIAAKIATDGVTIEGRHHEIDIVLPIAVLPEALPIGDPTAIRFKYELAKAVPGLDGAGKVRGAQILSQNHLEFYDKVWSLPDQAPEVMAFLVKRASKEPTRFGPVVFDNQELKIKHSGHTWDRLYASDSKELETKGPSRFLNQT